MKTLLLSSLVLLCVPFLFPSCKSTDCPDIGCLSFFRGGRVDIIGFDLQNRDNIEYIKCAKGNTTQHLDTFVVMVELPANNGNSPNNVEVSLGNKFDSNFDWKIIVDHDTTNIFNLTEINRFDETCTECIGRKNVYDEFTMKLNGVETNSLVQLRK